MTLHTVNKSPFSHACLASCLRLTAPDDQLLLIEDGVYAALPGQLPAAVLPQVAALLPDVEARGLTGRIDPGIRLVDYVDFVRLTEAQPRTLAWF